MELTHKFVVPTPVEETWTVFQDIARVAECFPGAQVTSAEGDAFRGTCKVRLGPIALVYGGSGTFVERDEAGHRFVVEAKGKDKRGNGTAGATVTLSMASSGGGTEVEVLTDLSITGKPAQFGRGVMQDVSDKLLGQFVACLEERLGSGSEDAPGADPAGPATGSDTDPAAPEPGGDRDRPPAAGRAAAVASAGGPTSPLADGLGAGTGDDALDLGSAVLPVLLRSYGKQVAGALLALVGLALVIRLLRR